MQVQALVPETAVERLDIRIVGRPAGPTEHQGDRVLVHPQVCQPTGKFTALVTVNPFRNTSAASNLFQYLHDLGRTHPECGGGCQALACIHVDHREHPKSRSSMQPVRHKVHRPGLIPPGGPNRGPVTMRRTHMPAGPLAVQLQPLQAVQPVYPLVVHMDPPVPITHP